MVEPHPSKVIVASSSLVSCSNFYGEDKMITKDQIENIFSYHRPGGDQPDRYETLRTAGKRLAKKIVKLCPEGEETNKAIEKLREAIMWANASIACNEVEEGDES